MCYLPNMKHIIISQGLGAMVDDEDYIELNVYRWSYSQGYAVRMTAKYGEMLYMHKVILGIGKGQEGDHIDGNKLNNTRANLRVVSHSQNIQNAFFSSNTSGYKGVTWHKRNQMWRAYIKQNKKQIHLGYFHDKDDAARAYDVVARQLFGPGARVNFPVPLVGSLPGPIPAL